MFLMQLELTTAKAEMVLQNSFYLKQTFPLVQGNLTSPLFLQMC